MLVRPRRTPVRTFNAIGATTARQTSCSGKAMLAMFPQARGEELLTRPLEKVIPTPESIRST
jgi:IclR family transcriptional regulator, acetate operon repressor